MAQQPQQIAHSFINKGLNLKVEPASLQQGEFSVLTNMVSLQEGALTIRAGDQNLTYTTGTNTFGTTSIIHTITKLHGSNPDARYCGVQAGATGFGIYRSTAALPTTQGGMQFFPVAKATATSPLYPNQRFAGIRYNSGTIGTPYMFFACPNKMLKDNGSIGLSLNSPPPGDGTGDGTVIEKWGILPPLSPVTATLDAVTVLPNTANPPTSNGVIDIVAAFGGSDANRLGGAVTVLNSTGLAPGNFVVRPSSMNNILDGMLLQIGTQYGIAAQITTSSFSCYLNTAPNNGDPITCSELLQSVTASPQTIQFNTGITPAGAAKFDGIAPDYTSADIVHVAVGLSQPSLMSDLRLRVLLNGSGTDYYEKSIAQSVVQPTAGLGQPATTTLVTTVPQTIQAIVGKFDIPDPVQESTKAANLVPISNLQASGNPVWTEIDTPKVDFVPVGRAGQGLYTWANVTGFQVVGVPVAVSAPFNLWVSSLYIAGGYGPVGENNSLTNPLQPYDYIYTFRNPITDTESTPCIPMIVNNYVRPQRQQVAVQCAGTADPQVATAPGSPSIVIYRRGGAFSDGLYRLVGYVTNPGVSGGAPALVTFFDNQSDASLEFAPIVEFDNDPPVTSGLPTPANISIATVAPFIGGFGLFYNVVISAINTGPTNAGTIDQWLRPGSILTIATGTPKQEQTRVVSITHGFPNTILVALQYDHTFQSGLYFTCNEITNQPCNIGCQAFDAIFLAGDPFNPHILYKSKTGLPEAFPTEELSTGIADQIVVGSPSNPIMAVTEFSSGVVCLNLTNIYYVSVFAGVMEPPQETPAQRGLVGIYAWVKVNNEIWYLSYDGIYSWSGGASQKRSEPLDPLFKGVGIGPYPAIDMAPSGSTNQAGSPIGVDLITMGYHNTMLTMVYHAADGNYYRLAYDMVYQRWWIESHDDHLNITNFPVAITATYTEQDTGNFLLAKSISGHPYLYLEDNEPGGTEGWIVIPNDGADITYSMKMAAITLNAPSLNKQYLDLIIEVTDNQMLWGYNVYYDFSTVADPTDQALFTSPTVNRRRQTVSLQGGYGKEAYGMEFAMSGFGFGGVPGFTWYSLTLNYIPLEQIQTGRAYDWDDLGWRWDKRLYDVTMEYDIPAGEVVNMYMDTYTGIEGQQQVNIQSQVYVLSAPTNIPVGAPSHMTSNFHIPAIIVKKIRFRPATVNAPFKYFSYTFGEFEKLPPDWVSHTPWSYYGAVNPGYDQYAQQLDLEVDTGGVAGTVSVFSDANPGVIAAGPYTVTTTADQRQANITLPPQTIGKRFRLISIAGAGGKFQIYNQNIIVLPADKGPVLTSYDWDDLGSPYDKQLAEITFQYDPNVGFTGPTTILMDTETGIKGETINIAAFSFVLDGSGRSIQTFPFTDFTFVKQVRLYPASNTTVWKEWKYQFLATPQPPDISLFTPIADLGWKCEKILRSLEVDISTGGVTCQVSVFGDGVSLYTFPLLTTDSDRRRIITLPSDLIVKNVWLELAPGTGGKAQVYDVSWEQVREPCYVYHFDSYEQAFGYQGWKYMYQAWFEYVAPSPIVLTFYTDGGVLFYIVTLPAHPHRDVERFFFPTSQFTNGAYVLNKSKKYRFQIDSAAPGFKLYTDATKLEWMPFGADQRTGMQQMTISEMIQIPIGEPDFAGAASH